MTQTEDDHEHKYTFSQSAAVDPKRMGALVKDYLKVVLVMCLVIL